MVDFDGYWFMGIDRVDDVWDFDGWVEYFDQWVLILIGLFFFGSLVGFDDLAADWVGDDLAWLGFGLGGWLKGFRLSGLVFLDDVGGVCDGSWVVMMVVMVAGCGVIVGSDGLWVCEREGQ